MYNQLEDICLSFYNDTYYYVCALCKDPDLAKDVTQETFLKALKALHTLRDPAKIKSWLFRIARNTYYTTHKKAKQFDVAELLEDLVDVRALSPEQRYLAREWEAWWEQLLTTLNKEERAILELRVNEKLPFEVIAEMLEMKAGAVRVRYHRLRMKVLKLLEQGVKTNA